MKTKYVFIIFILIFGAYGTVIGQNFFSTQLISSGGGQTDNATYQTSWSIGEPVTATASAGSYQLTQGFHQRIYPVMVAGIISANQSICYNTIPAPLAGTPPTGGLAPYTYQWQDSPNGSVWTDISGATGLNYQPPALTVLTYYRLIQTSAGGNGSVITNTVTITILPLPTPTIAGPATACAGSTGNVYSTQTGMTNYIWTVSPGGMITAGGTSTSPTVTVTWNTAGAQWIQVNYTNANGCTAASPVQYNVTVNPSPTPTITGPNSVCTGTSGNVYITQTGMTNYVWTVSAGGTITAGGTSTSSTVTVTWNSAGNQTVSVNYANANGCSALSPTVFNVTVNAPPSPTINGTYDPCVGQSEHYYTEAGMLNYLWTVTSGGTILSGQGTFHILVHWDSVGVEYLGVNYTNAQGCTLPSPVLQQIFVYPVPGPAGPITGTSPVCAGATGVVFSTTPITDATSYTWTVPPGATIASGSGTTSITVNFGANATSGNITVAGTNDCGNGTPSTFTVTVNPLPAAAGTITGPATVCQGDQGVSYSVPTITYATGYVWTLPPGATIATGTNTNNITVNFSNIASSGIITVHGTNSCGSGTDSPEFSVTVSPKPPTPVITEDGLTLISNASQGNQWYYNGVAIPGATNQTYEATMSGDYYVIVTINGCSSDPSNVITIVMPGISNPSGNNLTVYPVPNDGMFTISCTWITDEILTLEVYNHFGVRIYLSSLFPVHGEVQRIIDLRPVPNGVYTVVLRTADNRVVRRILINK